MFLLASNQIQMHQSAGIVKNETPSLFTNKDPQAIVNTYKESSN